MAINGLGSFDMMSNYNRIDYRDRVSALSSSVNQEAVNKEPVNQVEPIKEENKEQEVKVNLNFDGMRRRSSFSLDDISRDFNRRDMFSMSRVDDQSMRNDMLKAVSEMEKDTSLTQYQYFVGESNIIFADEDGTVMIK